jgi:hypothetical protein
MAKYKVMHDYQAVIFGGLRTSYATGQVLELIPVFADWVNRDSPGTLEPWHPEPPAEMEFREDRMMKKPGKRR